MDPLACTIDFIKAVQDGDFDIAARCQNNFSDWKMRGGFEPTLPDGNVVLQLDTEQDRFLVMDMTGAARWIDCFRYEV